LSADPERLLIGDDEHGWGEGTVFNMEAGCYAKCLNISEPRDPEIFQAIRFGALVENVAIDPQTRLPDYSDIRLTDNSRACYPLSHIAQVFKSITASEPKTIIFLSRDLNGVLDSLEKPPLIIF
jgi:phosphoenolpyruvate carboxykinase (ATP)